MGATGSTRSDRTWKWYDELSREKREIPKSWAVNGEKETATGDEVQLYAIAVKLGTLIGWKTSSRGNVKGDPVGERPAARVVYVTPDGTKKAYRQIIVKSHPEGGYVPKQSFTSVIAVTPPEDPPSHDDPEYVKEVIERLYGDGGC
jgi:hypothetical protein